MLPITGAKLRARRRRARARTDPADTDGRARGAHRRSAGPSPRRIRRRPGESRRRPADRASSPTPDSGSSKAKNRSPLVSMRSSEPSRWSATSVLELLEVPASSSLQRPGRAARISATCPSEDTAPVAVGEPLAEPAPVGRHQDHRARTEDRPVSAARTAPGRPGPRRSRRRSRPPLDGVSTTWAVTPACSEPAALEQVGRLLRVKPGGTERVLEILADRVDGADHQRRRRPARRRSPSRGDGRRTGPTGTESERALILTSRGCGCTGGRRPRSSS